MRQQMLQVLDFMRKFNRPIDVSIADESPAAGCVYTPMLEDAMRRLNGFFAVAYTTGHVGLVRAALVLEEACELVQALMSKNETEVADALADLLYVAYGTALTYDIPLEAVFDEVHRSNMTKQSVPGDAEVKCAKGPGFSRADVAGVLKRYRDRKTEFFGDKL